MEWREYRQGVKVYCFSKLCRTLPRKLRQTMTYPNNKAFQVRHWRLYSLWLRTGLVTLSTTEFYYFKNSNDNIHHYMDTYARAYAWCICSHQRITVEEVSTFRDMYIDIWQNGTVMPRRSCNPGMLAKKSEPRLLPNQKIKSLIFSKCAQVIWPC